MLNSFFPPKNRTVRKIQ